MKFQDNRLLKNHCTAGRWWHTPLIPALGRQRQVDLCEFETSLVYRGSSKIGSKATEKPCLEKTKQTNKQKKNYWGWRDGSVVKSTTCSSKGPEFNSQKPHGSSQPSVMRSGALFWPAGRVLRILYIYIINK